MSDFPSPWDPEVRARVAKASIVLFRDASEAVSFYDSQTDRFVAQPVTPNSRTDGSMILELTLQFHAIEIQFLPYPYFEGTSPVHSGVGIGIPDQGLWAGVRHPRTCLRWGALERTEVMRVRVSKEERGAWERGDTVRIGSTPCFHIGYHQPIARRVDVS